MHPNQFRLDSLVIESLVLFSVRVVLLVIGGMRVHANRALNKLWCIIRWWA